MSLLNCWVGDDRALVSVDTTGLFLHNGSRREVSKMIPHVAANVVLAGRGHINFLRCVSDPLFAFGLDFDEICTNMPDSLRLSYQHMVDTAPAFAGVAEWTAQEVVVVGWSRERNRMCAVAYTQSTWSSQFSAAQVEASVAPWLPEMGQHPEPTDAATHERIARAQMRYCLEKDAEAVIGGRLLLAEITRHTLSVRTVCELSTVPAAIDQRGQ